MGYLARSKGWKFWNLHNGEFIESAHARWIDEEGDGTERERSQPIPDPPLDINKLLNSAQVDGFTTLIEILEAMKLDDSSITENVRSQDAMTENVRVLAAGIAKKLPRSYKLAMKSTEAVDWKNACEKEISMLRSMKVWEEIALPAGKLAVSSKWVFNQKQNSEGIVTKHKARFVVRGFNQEQGVNFNETFAPTA